MLPCPLRSVVQEHRYCTTCDTHIPPDAANDPLTSFRQPWLAFTSLASTDRADPGSVASAIQDSLADEQSLIQRPCPQYGSLQSLTQRFRIDAAPEYLAVKLNILYQNKQSRTDDVSVDLFGDDDNTVYKITCFSELPAIDQYFNLTQNQVNTSAQLWYKLSTTILLCGKTVC
jgi:hypothetical protein